MESQPIIKMRSITKRFPGVTANDAVDLDLFPGEVHTLLGENGAGKSTLMHILAGMVQPEAGRIEVNERPVKIRSPVDALKLGIGMVYQHFALVPNLTAMENIIIGFEDGFVLRWRQLESRLKKILDAYALSLPLNEKVLNLSVGEQQRVEIVKALFHESDVLILDEPTSVLTPLETGELFKTVSALVRLGKTVVFITHKLKEARSVSDRISILRSGKKIAEFSGKMLREMDAREGYRTVFDVMFDDYHLPEHAPPTRSFEAKPILALDRVFCAGNRGAERLKKVSLTLKSGEIFGIAGVDGNGQKELAEVIGGQRKVSSGRLLLHGKDITRRQDPSSRMELGISYITDDRMQEGCVLSMSVAENAILRLFRHPPFSRWKILNRANIEKHTRDLIAKFDIKASGTDIRVSALSGGNIQKLLLARELSNHPAILVCNKPTHGLDAKTTDDVRSRLQQERARGAAILLISSDLDELLCYADRIGVLYNGELLEILDSSCANQENIGRLMLGIRQ
jgi:general nucleoside transport system ATP-binding protein